MIVTETLKMWRTTPFVWGARDCMLSIGDYIMLRTGIDAVTRFRGTYDDEAGALAHVAAYGGIAGLVDLTGLPRTETPMRGDVVALCTGETQVGALCTGDTIAARLERGIVEINMRFVTIAAAWKIA